MSRACRPVISTDFAAEDNTVGATNIGPMAPNSSSIPVQTTQQQQVQPQQHHQEIPLASHSRGESEWPSCNENENISSASSVASRGSSRAASPTSSLALVGLQESSFDNFNGDSNTNPLQIRERSDLNMEEQRKMVKIAQQERLLQQETELLGQLKRQEGSSFHYHASHQLVEAAKMYQDTTPLPEKVTRSREWYQEVHNDVNIIFQAAAQAPQNAGELSPAKHVRQELMSCNLFPTAVGLDGKPIVPSLNASPPPTATASPTGMNTPRPNARTQHSTPPTSSSNRQDE